MTIKGVEEIAPKLETDPFLYGNILNDRNIFVEATACTNISQDSRSATKPPRCRITKGRAVQVAVPTTWIEIAATRTRSDCCTGNDVRTKVVPQKSATHCWQHPLSHDPNWSA